MTTLDGTETHAHHAGTPGAPLIGMAPTDRCPSCGAEMAPDQRYCVNCGNRRGKPRYSLDNRPAAAAPVATEAVAARSWSSSLTLLTGLAILLLALGIGVLIGGSGSSNTAKPIYHITINGGGSGGSSSGSSGSSGVSTTPAASTGGSNSGKSGGSKPKISKAKAPKVVKGPQKATNSGNLGAAHVNVKSLHTKKQRQTAEKKQLKSSATKLANGKVIAPETMTVGEKCASNIVGCVNGTYQGNWAG